MSAWLLLLLGLTTQFERHDAGGDLVEMSSSHWHGVIAAFDMGVQEVRGSMQCIGCNRYSMKCYSHTCKDPRVHALTSTCWYSLSHWHLPLCSVFVPGVAEKAKWCSNHNMQMKTFKMVVYCSSQTLVHP